MKENEILKIYGTDYKEMTKLLLTEAELESRSRQKCQDWHASPNLVAPSEASWGATTHPEIVAGIIEYLQERGFTQLLVLEGSWLGIKLRNLPKYVDIWTFAGNMEFLLWIHRRTLFMYATVKGWS